MLYPYVAQNSFSAELKIVSKGALNMDGSTMALGDLATIKSKPHVFGKVLFVAHCPEEGRKSWKMLVQGLFPLCRIQTGH